LTALVSAWLPHGKSAELGAALDRLARTEDVEHIAVMPDAHVAEEVCVGTVTATTRRLLPAAVGGDIGCGMVALRLRAEADLLADRGRAAQLLAGLYQRIPHGLYPAAAAPLLPEHLREAPLGAPALEAMKRREGRMEFGTLGRGNHFLEVQRDDEGALWLLVHRGGPQPRSPRVAPRAHALGASQRMRWGSARVSPESSPVRWAVRVFTWRGAATRAHSAPRRTGRGARCRGARRVGASARGSSCARPVWDSRQSLRLWQAPQRGVEGAHARLASPFLPHVRPRSADDGRTSASAPALGAADRHPSSYIPGATPVEVGAVHGEPLAFRGRRRVRWTDASSCPESRFCRLRIPFWVRGRFAHLACAHATRVPVGAHAVREPTGQENGSVHPG
jgi:tRNA-splicing ligase RtcB